MKEADSILKDIYALRLAPNIKECAKNTLLRLIRDIDNNHLDWVEPSIQCVYTTYIVIQWRKETRYLTLNIDSEKQWLSKYWYQDNKIRSGFDDFNLDNLSINWSWLING